MGGQFPTTRWSVVLSAKPTKRASGEALRQLCEAYWRPLYVFLRREGMSSEDAEDAVQGFLATLLDGPGITGADRDRGRFRSYLLGALKHHVAKERARESAQKRGGGQALLSLDVHAAEAHLQIPDTHTPEAAYAYAWAVELLQRARQRLADAYRAEGKGELFSALEPFLDDQAPRYRDIAAQLGMSEATARVSVHRLRARLGKQLRAGVAETVASEAEIDDELRAVIAATRAPGSS